MIIKFKQQKIRARKELKEARKGFKRKRETVLIRVQKKWHTPLLQHAREKKKTLSKLHDEIYPFYLRHNTGDG
ncbi:hypothetical protein KW790_01655 [Candidatus Parcubacteria bacterium]|nr:hypothetical protein [Candidatus Parcubacteria bacterium]